MISYPKNQIFTITYFNPMWREEGVVVVQGVKEIEFGEEDSAWLSFKDPETGVIHHWPAGLCEVETRGNAKEE